MMPKSRLLKVVVASSFASCTLIASAQAPKAKTNNASPPAKTLNSVHLKQQHFTIGVGDCYYSGSNVKFIWSEGDVAALYRGDTDSIYIYNPKKKVIYQKSFSEFSRKRNHFDFKQSRKREGYEARVDWQSQALE